jgi:3-hydroxyacyl-CoA dehydrogenase/enoyl-CoA hydratase/3-hydroxybutyryl-CoA epimerase
MQYLSDNFAVTDSGDRLILIFDMKGEKVNKLTSSAMHELDVLLADMAEVADKYNYLIIMSAKDVFIAGADINEILSMDSSRKAYGLVASGQAVLRGLERLPIKTIAVIDGACLGGGLELALACDHRVAIQNPKTSLGLPEVNLGVIPGFGGTKRLPELIGITKAMGMILSGKPVDGKKALKYGLVDAYVPRGCDVVEAVEKAKPRKCHKGENNLLMREVVAYFSKKSVMEKTKGHYPAPLDAIQVIKRGLGKDMHAANKLEARAFAKLATESISKNLINLYFNSEALKKQKLEGVQGTKIDKVAVVGAGIMGSGIAWTTSYNGYPTIMKDMSSEALQRGYKNVYGIYKQLKKIRKVNDRDIEQKMYKLSHSLGDKGLDSVDLVVEAIVENMEIKQSFFADMESKVSPSCILATNTSTLDIDIMAEKVQDKSRFVGLHFFNPVNRMPLVEIIKGKDTSDETIQAMLDLCKRCRKVPVIVKNSPGFVVNRILIPYLNEACKLCEDGVSIREVDQIYEEFGLPMGPFTLMDTIGLDVCYHVSESLNDFYEPRIQTSKLFAKLYEQGLKGKKGGEGFYIYGGKKKIVNPKFASGACIKSDREILNAGLSVMKREAELCLEEGIVDNENHLNTALVYGIGFPPFRGSIL